MKTIMIKNKPKTVGEILKGFTIEEINTLDISHTVGTGDNAVNVSISGEMILNEFKSKYSMFNFVHVKTRSDFLSDFRAFVTSREKDIANIIDSLYNAYNPVENYDKTSETTTTLNINKAEIETETLQTADNTTSYFGQSKVISRADPTKDMSNRVEERTHGNIGVTTNQQMIISELALRTSHNAVSTIIDMYADREIY